MKNRLYILLFTLGVTLLTSCFKLDEVPLSQLSPYTYFSNANELELYSNRFYSDNFPTAEFIYGDNADAIIITQLDDAVSGQRTVPSTGSGWSWSQLRSINYLLENSKNTSDATVRNRYNALARFFRGYFYFSKLTRFGEVPWFDTVLRSDDPLLFKKRDSRDLIADSIISDLKYAVDYLPADKQNVYKVNKWAALALLSRVALFEGTYRKYHGIAGYEKYLNICIEASAGLIDNGGYTLYASGIAPYRDLFATTTTTSQEVILARDYSREVNLPNNVQNYCNSSAQGRPGLSKTFVNSYLMSDGSRFTDIPGYGVKTFSEETQNRDPRLSQTIRTPGYTRIGSSTPVAPNLAFTSTGYYLIKYTMEPNNDSYNNSITDMPLFRIAEVYLNYAEAKAESGTLTQADLDKTVNLIRGRVKMPSLNMATANATPDPYLLSSTTGYPGVTGANVGVILEIRRERSVELIMEGFRYNDMMRWKAGKLFEKPFLGAYFPGPGDYDLNGDGTIDVCLYQGTQPPSSATLFLRIGSDIVLTNGTSGNILVHGNISRTWREDRDYLYPIPSEEINLSNGTLKQNPNW